jgi:hypothetical protein
MEFKVIFTDTFLADLKKIVRSIAVKLTATKGRKGHKGNKAATHARAGHRKTRDVRGMIVRGISARDVL